jgi:hypothetical protein
LEYRQQSGISLGRAWEQEKGRRVSGGLDSD